MSYKLYTDKPTKFNCNIEIEGTSLSMSKIRLVVESPDMTYMFPGTIENTGICEVNIPKTKHFLPEGTMGSMRLEVIADDVFFEPWSSEFEVKTNKKVAVQVVEQIEDKPKLKIQVIEQVEPIKKPEPKVEKVVKKEITKNYFTKEELLRKLKGG